MAQTDGTQTSARLDPLKAASGKCPTAIMEALVLVGADIDEG